MATTIATNLSPFRVYLDQAALARLRIAAKSMDLDPESFARILILQGLPMTAAAAYHDAVKRYGSKGTIV